MPYELPRILIVDDDPDTCELLPVLLQIDGDRYDITTRTSFYEARDLIAARSFDLYIFDYFMPEMSGARFCEGVRQFDNSTPIIIYSAGGPKSVREDSIRAGADLFLTKPNDLDRIAPSVREMLGRRTMAAPVRPIYKMRARSIL